MEVISKGVQNFLLRKLSNAHNFFCLYRWILVRLKSGDILKFAGDAFFAEWRVQEVDNDDDDNVEFRSHSDSSKGLQQLNQSLFSSQEFCYRYDNSTVSACVSQAAKCAASIVEKLSDYHVSVPTIIDHL